MLQVIDMAGPYVHVRYPEGKHRCLLLAASKAQASYPVLCRAKDGTLVAAHVSRRGLRFLFPPAELREWSRVGGALYRQRLIDRFAVRPAPKQQEEKL